MFTFQESEIKNLLNALAKEYKVFVPAKVGDESKFVPYDDNVELYWDRNVLLSVKDKFFPHTEPMYKFKTKRKTVEIEPLASKDEPVLLFGVRSCDLQALNCLDQVFLTKGFVDEFYRTKRDQATIVALGCNEAEDTCFCTAMGVDPQKGNGADIQAYRTQGKFGMEALTEKGQKIIDILKSYLKEENLQVPETQGFQLQPDMDGVAEKLKGMFDAELWAEVAPTCLNCGACTYICPTCHCFDISQDVRGEEGFKYRCWDSCMFEEYTLMAGGHNPRPSKKERVRNRFMHKLCYFPERYNMLLCTGCGRCLNVCPVNLHITSIIGKVKEAN